MAKKNYTEGELIKTFGLQRIVSYQTPAMKEWLDTEPPVFNPIEAYIFEEKYNDAVNNIVGWNEEKLKMRFISAILPLGHINDTDKYVTFYEKNLSHIIKGYPLSVKTDFMVATGMHDVFEKPYFHFQEYKPEKNPSGDSMSQLLQAMMIAQELNDNKKPLYGCEIIGKSWAFVILEGNSYCISRPFNSIDKDDLMKIIAVLRKFKYILETRLIID